MKKKLTYERLIRLVRYEPKSGKFFWILRDKRQRNLIVLKHSGITGYMYLCLYGKWYPAQEIAYLYQEREFSNKEILFKNGHKHNLKWENIILGRKKVKDVETINYILTAVSGVWYNEEENLWKVTIPIRNKKITVGFYANFNQAVRVRWETEKTFQHPSRYTTSEAFKYLMMKNLI